VAVHLDDDRWRTGRHDNVFVLAVLGYFLLWQRLVPDAGVKTSRVRRRDSRATKRPRPTIALWVRVARGLRSWAP